MSTDYMQSFNLLALKLRPCIGNTGKDRQLLWLQIYIVRWNTWPLRSQGFFLLGWHVFPQLNWLTDWKKVSQKDLEKVKGEKRSWSCVTEEVVHSILWCTQSTYTQQWQTAAARNELKDCLYCSFCELFSSALFLSLLLGCCQTVPHAKFYSSR